MFHIVEDGKSIQYFNFKCLESLILQYLVVFLSKSINSSKSCFVLNLHRFLGFLDQSSEVQSLARLMVLLEHHNILEVWLTFQFFSSSICLEKLLATSTH